MRCEGTLRAAHHSRGFRPKGEGAFLCALNGQYCGGKLDRGDIRRLMQRSFTRTRVSVTAPVRGTCLCAGGARRTRGGGRSGGPIVARMLRCLRTRCSVHEGAVLRQLRFVSFRRGTSKVGKGCQPLEGGSCGSVFMGLRVTNVSYFRGCLGTIVSSGCTGGFGPFRDCFCKLGP